MNILVTGATGFIGFRIAQTLENEGHRVVFSGRRAVRDHVSIQGDLSDRAFCQTAVQGIETVIHSAGLAGTWGPYSEYEKANVTSTANLIEEAKAAGVKRFINISSPSIYFDFRDQLNLKETDRPEKFSNAYAETKWRAEQLVSAAHAPSFLTVSLRPRSVIGAGDQNVLPRLIRLKESGSLVQIGSGANVVDITTVGNLVDAVKLCLTGNAPAMGEVYNITNGAPVKLWDFADMVLKKAGLSTDRRRLPLAPVMAAARLNEFVSQLLGVKKEPALLPISIGVIAFSMTMDISKAREKLGYRPRLSTEDGVDEFIGWWKAR